MQLLASLEEQNGAAGGVAERPLHQRSCGKGESSPLQAQAPRWPTATATATHWRPAQRPRGGRGRPAQRPRRRPRGPGAEPARRSARAAGTGGRRSARAEATGSRRSARVAAPGGRGGTWRWAQRPHGARACADEPLQRRGRANPAARGADPAAACSIDQPPAAPLSP